MNSCDYYQELISRLVDGEISREEHEALMAHLNTCSRCNAMYAVFHDLSDILSEESVPLPEGLHENIMAGVRRSEMMKKNRRLRRFGLRMALSAAACALLVLFAASGFGPGKHTENINIRTQEAAEQLYQTQAETLPAPTENVFALPAQTQAPMPAQIQTPVQTPYVPETPDVYYAAGSSLNETPYTLQHEQYNPYQYDQYTAPAAVQTPEPYAAQSPDFTLQTPEPAAVQTPAPTAEQASAKAAVPASSPAELQTPAPELAADVEAPMLLRAAPEITTSQIAAFDAPESDAGETADSPASFTMQSAEPEASESATVEEPEDSGEFVTFSLSTGVRAGFDAAGPEKDTDISGEAALSDDVLPESALPGLTLMSQMPEEIAQPEVFMPDPEESAAEEYAAPVAPTRKKPAEQNFRIYGREWRDRLLALLGSSESALPADAELTRVLHVTLCPDDVYGSEEKLEINIYDDFAYYSLSPAENGVRSYRAECALKELDELLKLALETASTPSPTPTADLYAGTEPTE